VPFYIFIYLFFQIDVETKQKCQGEQEIIRGAVGGSGPDEEKSPEKIHNTTKAGLTKEDQLRMQNRDNNINPALQKMPGQSPESINGQSFHIRNFVSDYFL
jgi:hypothetical protein